MKGACAMAHVGGDAWSGSARGTYFRLPALSGTPLTIFSGVDKSSSRMREYQIGVFGRGGTTAAMC